MSLRATAKQSPLIPLWKRGNGGFLRLRSLFRMKLGNFTIGIFVVTTLGAGCKPAPAWWNFKLVAAPFMGAPVCAG